MTLPSPSPPGSPRDDGSATVLVVALLAFAALLGGVGACVGQAVVARHRAEAAADLGALAGAQALLTGEAPACARARDVVSANAARLRACTVHADNSVTVTVTVDLRGVLTAAGAAHGTARAGPAPGAAGSQVPLWDSRTSSSRTAAALSRGSFPLPHLGE